MRYRYALNGMYMSIFLFVVIISVLLLITAIGSLSGSNSSYSPTGAVIVLVVLGFITILAVHVTPIEYVLDEKEFIIRFLLRSVHLQLPSIRSVRNIDSNYFAVSPFRRPRLIGYGVQAMYFNSNGGIDRCFISSDSSTLVQISTNETHSYILTIDDQKFVEELQKRTSLNYH
jgi:hypothetical protein